MWLRWWWWLCQHNPVLVCFLDGFLIFLRVLLMLIFIFLNHIDRMCLFTRGINLRVNWRTVSIKHLKAMYLTVTVRRIQRPCKIQYRRWNLSFSVNFFLLVPFHNVRHQLFELNAFYIFLSEHLLPLNLCLFNYDSLCGRRYLWWK